MNIRELQAKALKEMQTIAYNNRKDIYMEFEYNYLHLLNKQYSIVNYQSTYIFEKDNKLYSLHIKTRKNGIYHELINIAYYDNTNSEIIRYNESF